MEDDIFYSDFSTNLTPHPIKKDLVRLIDEEAIKKSIKNLLLTNSYERPFQPLIGGNISALLFEPMLPTTQIALEQSIINCIENYEPRVNLIEVKVVPNYEMTLYAISITFSLINRTTPVVLNMTLERVR